MIVAYIADTKDVGVLRSLYKNKMILQFWNKEHTDKVRILDDKYKFFADEKNLKKAIVGNKELTNMYGELAQLKREYKIQAQRTHMCEYDRGNWKFQISNKKDQIILELLLPLKKELEML